MQCHDYVCAPERLSKRITNALGPRAWDLFLGVPQNSKNFSRTASVSVRM